MPAALKPTTIAIVKATVPALAAHGATITAEMYARLFENPEVRSLFNQANQGEGGKQAAALATAILAYARNIENLAALGPAVERIAQKHIGFNIMPEHYPYVAEALLGAISHVLGAAATPEILEAWGEAYWFLADILKGREQTLRQDLTASEGGWVGWRDFVVSEKTRESTVITSFVLEPADHAKVLQHKPGQYLTFALSPEGKPAMKRNFSISSGPNDKSYRISVKRESDSHGGSIYLHDQVQVGSHLQVGPPAGEFFLSADQARPIILLSAGVGLTPMVSMLESLVGHPSDVSVHYIHGATNSETDAMKDHVAALAKQSSRIAVKTFYSQPLQNDVLGTSYDVAGRITVEWLQANLALADADIYLCGPRAFLRDLVSGLSLAGIPACRLHYEFFGPADELLAA